MRKSLIITVVIALLCLCGCEAAVTVPESPEPTKASEMLLTTTAAEESTDIKVIDKAAVASERMKTALVRSKDQFENLMDDGQVTPSEYAEDKIRYAAEDVADRVGHEVSSETKKAVNKSSSELGRYFLAKHGVKTGFSRIYRSYFLRGIKQLRPTSV